MKEFFMMGVLCLINPVTSMDQCMYVHENPIIYYTEEDCKIESVKKVNEMGTNLTSQGFVISQLSITCVVDKSKLNT
jgi:hypothetical protein